MESSAVVDVANTKSSNDVAPLNEPKISVVPDVVTNVSEMECPTEVAKPDPTSTPAQDSPSANLTAKPVSSEHDPKSLKTTSQPATSEAPARSRNAREDKSRKKDDKSVDHVLKALSSLSTPEEKLAAMCKKYADFFDEHRKLQMLQKQTEKRCSGLQREKEQLQAEHSKAILTRSRLENLCRELQRQNKAIKDESLLKIREEEEKRKEVSAKFQTTMNEITTLMQQNSDKNMKLRDDNIDMSTKLKNICEQYELRQQQVERISKQMQLEQQLSEAKLTKFKLEMASEREMMLKEKQELLMELQQYKQRCTEFQATELNLRNQISFYNDKYDEFQKSLARSNDVVGGFKGEMERMTKKICKLEKETSSWKQRWERSNNVQLEMAAAKQKSDQEMAVVSRQLVTLQSLCRTLQTERSNLLTKIKLLQANQQEPHEKVAINSCNKYNKQCNQVINNSEPPNCVDMPLNNMSENVPILSHCTKDSLTSHKESEKTMEVPLNTVSLPLIETSVKSNCVTSSPDTPAHVPVTNPDTPTHVPVTIPDTPTHVSATSSPLPDVVGGSNVCVTQNHQDKNSVLCQRLEDESKTQQVLNTLEKSNTLLNSSAVEEDPRAHEPVSQSLPNQGVLLDKTLSSQIENLHVTNGDLKSPPTEENLQNNLSLSSLEHTQTLTATGKTVQSLDCEKKPKEAKKKKK